jgi:hypothetical protein
MVAVPIMMRAAVVTMGLPPMIRPVIGVPGDTLAAPVQTRIDPVAFLVEVRGEMLASGAQVVGQILPAKSFGTVGPPVEMSFNAIGLAVESGIDAVALTIEAGGDALTAVVKVQAGSFMQAAVIRVAIRLG